MRLEHGHDSCGGSDPACHEGIEPRCVDGLYAAFQRRSGGPAGYRSGNGDGESEKFWFACLAELKNRGVKRCVLHGLRRPEGAAEQHRAGVARDYGPDAFDPPVAQQFRLRLEEALAEIAANLKPIYETASPQAARRAFEELAEK